MKATKNEYQKDKKASRLTTLKTVFAIVALSFISASCSKDDAPTPIETPTKTTNVYVAGYEKNLAGKTVAKYWKNGIETVLTSGANNSQTKAMTVVGNDVYVVGYETETFLVAKIWKNGVATNLTNGTNNAQATCISIVGSDIYVGGWESDANLTRIAKIWKNGVATSITDGAFSAEVNSIYVIGTDVYAAGYQINGIGKRVTKYWKNGVSSSLTNGTSDANAYSLFIAGADIYLGDTTQMELEKI